GLRGGRDARGGPGPGRATGEVRAGAARTRGRRGLVRGQGPLTRPPPGDRVGNLGDHGVARPPRSAPGRRVQRAPLGRGRAGTWADVLRDAERATERLPAATGVATLAPQDRW